MFRQLLRNAKLLEVECLRTELGYEEQQLAHPFEKGPREVAQQLTIAQEINPDDFITVGFRFITRSSSTRTTATASSGL